MAHGAPDDSNVVGVGPIHVTADLSEHAVRLGSPAVISRSGNVLFSETWGCGFHGWERGTFLVGPYVRLSNATYIWDGVSLCLYAHAANNAAAYVSRRVPLLDPRLYGVGFWFAGADGDGYIRFWLASWHGGVTYGYEIRITPATGLIELYDSTPAYIPIVTVGALDSALYAWYWVKLTIDDEKPLYRSLWFGDREYDLSDYAPAEGIALEDDRLAVVVSVVGRAAGDQIAYIDGVVLTTTEERIA